MDFVQFILVFLTYLCVCFRCHFFHYSGLNYFVCIHTNLYLIDVHEGIWKDKILFGPKSPNFKNIWMKDNFVKS